MNLFPGLSAMRDSNEQEVKRHCGKTAPADFLDGDSAVELVFHTNQGDACKGFAFQYRLETSKNNELSHSATSNTE